MHCSFKQIHDEEDNETDHEHEILSKLISIFETNDDGKITLTDFVNIVKNASEGKLPRPTLNLTEEEFEAYNNATLVQKVSFIVLVYFICLLLKFLIK